MQTLSAHPRFRNLHPCTNGAEVDIRLAAREAAGLATLPGINVVPALAPPLNTLWDAITSLLRYHILTTSA
jgi:hypothetical protein